MKRLPGIGATIRRLREQRGLTQEELADRLGISQPNVSRWEKQDGNPSIALLPRLAEALGVTIAELLDDGNESVAS